MLSVIQQYLGLEKNVPIRENIKHEIVIKDGIQGTVIISKMAPERHQLCDCQGADILILISDAAPFTGERAPAEITPLQSTFIEDENDGEERE